MDQKRIGRVELFAQFGQFRHQIRGGFKRVDPELRFAAVALPACGCESEPENAFFSHFDQRAVSVSGIGNHDQIVIPEYFFRQVKNIVESLVAGSFLVGDEKKPNGG